MPVRPELAKPQAAPAPSLRPREPAAPDPSSEQDEREPRDEQDEQDERDEQAGLAAPAADPLREALLNRRLGTASNRETRQREAEEDRVLIAKAQAGDKAAFRQLVERHQRRAFSLAMALVRDENDARELVQDAFLRVYKGLQSFQGGSSFFTWLYRIITNLSIDLLRKPAHRMAELDESKFDTDESLVPTTPFPLVGRFDGSDPADVVKRSEIAKRLEAALVALPPYHRGVILMREVDGLSYEEMAQAMGVSKGTIMSRLFHARQKLQRALADCYEEQLGVRAPHGGEALPARGAPGGEDES